MLKLLKHYPKLTICLFVALMLLPNLETVQVSIMEARNFITAREMLTNKHWLLTTMNGVARYQKPPLPSWSSAFSGYIFGEKNVFAMRLPAVFMVMLIGSFMYNLSRIILKENLHSIINALVLVTSFYVIGITFEAPSDIFTHAFMLVAITYLFKLLKMKTTSWKPTVIAGLFLGLSILSKGPIAMYVLLLPFIIAYGFTYKINFLKQKLPYLLGAIGLGLAIGGSWYLYVKLQDPTVLNTIINQETSTWKDYNVRPFYYYWSFFTQSGIWTIPAFISLLYPYLIQRVKYKKAYQFTFIWTIAAVILLSLIPMKKSRYLMPVLIPLAFNIGFYIEYLIREFKNLKDKREMFPVYFNFGLIGLVGVVVPIVMIVLFSAEFQNHRPRFYLASIVLFTIGLLILLQLKAKRIKYVCLLTVIFMASVFIFVLPLSEAFKNKNFKSLAALKEDNKLHNINLYSLNGTVPEAIWDYGESIPEIKKEANTFVFPNHKRFGILSKAMKPDQEAKLRGLYHIKKIGTYDLNYFGKASNQNNPRLKQEVYMLTKKD